MGRALQGTALAVTPGVVTLFVAALLAFFCPPTADFPPADHPALWEPAAAREPPHVRELGDEELLRGADALILDAIRDGLDRSPTLRDLVGRLRKWHGIVRVHPALKLSAGLEACLLHQMVITSDGYRVMWVLVRSPETSDYLITLIAHELQHAVEALEAGAFDSAGMERAFRRLGERTTPGRVGENGVYETAAADEVQDRVWRELRATPTSR